MRNAQFTVDYAIWERDRTERVRATATVPSGENVDEAANRSLGRLLHELEKCLGCGLLDVACLFHDGDLTVDVGGQRLRGSRDSGNRHIPAIGTSRENLNRSAREML